MIALTVDPETSPSPRPDPEPRRQPDLSVLEDRAPDWAKLSRNTALLTLCGCTLFVVLSYLPLWFTDIWGHISYGRWIVQHGALPQTEPLLPLCQGVPFIDTAWLSQVLSHLAVRSYGPAALQFYYAAAISFCAALLGGAVLRRSGSLFWSLAAIASFGVIDYQQLIVVRPQLAGLAAFVTTLVLLTSTWRTAYWVALPVLFAAWANLHGSFPMGLLLIACFALGRAADLLRRTGQWRAVWRDATFRRHGLLLELCAAAVLINPYGLLVYLETFKIAGNPNLQDLIEWEPLTLRMKQGPPAAIALLALGIVFRFTPRRITTAEVLALTVFGLGACWSSRIVIWWGPLAALTLAVHGAAITRKRFPPAAPRRSGLWTVATIGLVWIAFAYTPFGVRVIHGSPKTEEEAARRWRRALATRTPIDATHYLHANPPRGLVFNTYEWGDYLLFAGPRDLQCFVASHAHLVPREVWVDYLRIAAAAPDARNKLDRYGVNTVVVDKHGRADLIRLLRESDAWQLNYEDPLAAIFVRKQPI